MKKECPLCNTKASLFYKDTQTYYKCCNCYGIFVDKDELPNEESEKERYELHDDDTEDLGYIKFVSPITSAIMNDFKKTDDGLDFGAGTSAIIASVLHKSDYMLRNYDPYFHINPELLEQKYDYISSCEVVEHFYNPHKEFLLLRKLLKDGGKLYLMTEPYKDGIDFSKWYYKNDPTHVFFYTQKTFEWIKKEYGFSSLKIDARLIVLST